MDQDRLITILQEKVARIERETTEAAEHERDAILADADERAGAMEQQVLDRVKAQSERLRDRKYNAVWFRVNAHRYELKSRAIEDVWRDVAVMVRRIAGSDEYPAILERLFTECMTEAPDGSEVRVSPDDAGRVRSLVKQSKRDFTVTEVPDIRWGVEFRWPDGEVAVINTLEHRLNRLRDEGNAAVSSVLFGGEHS